MYARREMEFTEARQRMARMPGRLQHIANPVSTAPGFNIGNVHVSGFGVLRFFRRCSTMSCPPLRSGTRIAFDGDFLPLRRR